MQRTVGLECAQWGWPLVINERLFVKVGPRVVRTDPEWKEFLSSIWEESPPVLMFDVCQIPSVGPMNYCVRMITNWAYVYVLLEKQLILLMVIFQVS